MKDVYRMHAEFFRIIAHPKRLEILDLLRENEMNVTQLAKEMDVRTVNVSQELAPLRSAGVVETRREGKTVFYRLSNHKIIRAYELIAQAMRELASVRAGVVQEEPRASTPPHAV
jgi:ArsR family transcriptional regulator